MKSIIITGGTRGIGYHCALQLARLAPNEQIILAARSLASGEEAIAKIRKETGHQHLKSLPLDVASLASIRQFVNLFAKETSNKIIALVNNAGGQNIGAMQYTVDGIEETFGTNHLGGFALSLLLMPFMDNETSITFTASGTHDPEKKEGVEPPVYHTAEKLAHPKPTSEKQNIAGQRRYSTSKLCVIMGAYQLQQHLNGGSIRVNSFDPGLVPGTGLARTYPPVLKFLWKNVMPILTLFRRNTNSAKKSGTNLANLAFAEQYRNLRGKYVEGTKVIDSSKDSYNPSFQKDLWDTSIRLACITPADTTLSLAGG